MPLASTLVMGLYWLSVRSSNRGLTRSQFNKVTNNLDPCYCTLMQKTSPGNIVISI